MHGDLPSFQEYLISQADEAGFHYDHFRPLPEDQAMEVASAIKDHSGASVRLMWWGTTCPCDLPIASLYFPDNRGWAHVPQVAPNTVEMVWLIPETWSGDTRRFLVFAAKPSTISAVLGNSHGFEYLMASKQSD